MSRARRSVSLVAVTAFIMAVMMQPAHAYLDPGTATLIYQIGYIVFYGLIGFIAVFYNKIKFGFSLLFRRFRKQTAEPQKAPAPPDAP